MTPGPPTGTVPFPFVGDFQASIIAPPPPYTIFFHATLKDGITYEYDYASPDEDDAFMKVSACNDESFIFDQGPTPCGGRFFNNDKLGGAYDKFPV
jgi:hypothetical protein